MRSLYVLVLILSLSGCFHNEDDDPVVDNGFSSEFPGDQAKSDKSRDQSAEISQADLDAQIANNTNFSIELFRKLTGNTEFQNKNIVFSPFSLSLTTAMLSAGATNNTLDEINQAMHFNTDQLMLHNAFNTLDLAYASRAGSYSRVDNSTGEIQLNITNALWGQTDYSFEDAFLDTLAVNYGAGMNLVNFVTDPEIARTEINQWVSTQTNNKITDAMPRGSVNIDTRLVLTNTVYLKADWFKPFSVPSTREQDFVSLDGTTVTTPFMNQDASFSYLQAADVTAVEMPFVGENLAMLIVMPDAGSFETYESSFDKAELARVMSNLQNARILLSMPKFNFETDLPLKDTLISLGIEDAFKENIADLSGIDDTTKLFVFSAIHKAFITVEESGLEAGAFTGFGVNVSSLPPSIIIDNPFLFIIRDTINDSILFFGRVLDPSS